MYDKLPPPTGIILNDGLSSQHRMKTSNQTNPQLDSLTPQASANVPLASLQADQAPELGGDGSLHQALQE